MIMREAVIFLALINCLSVFTIQKTEMILTTNRYYSQRRRLLLMGLDVQPR